MIWSPYFPDFLKMKTSWLYGGVSLIWQIGGLVRVSIVVRKQYDQKKLAEERVYFILQCCSSPREVKGTQGQTLEAGTEAEALASLLSVLLLMACSPALLNHPVPPALGGNSYNGLSFPTSISN